MSGYECKAAKVVPGQAATVPGVFTISGTQLCWTPDDSNAAQRFTVSMEAITGQLQKAKSKPQMRIPTLSGPLMLEFASVDARDEAIRQLPLDRKPPAAPVVEPTGPLAAVKKQLLQEDADLNGLYTELVKGGVITDADFWKSRQDLVQRKAAGGATRQQAVGLSSALLAQLKPSTDGKGKQITMTITPRFIQQVFAEKPHVHAAFLEHVPHKMDEKEFWTRFAKHEIQVQERRKAASKRFHEPLDPLFNRPVTHQTPKLDAARIDPTVNLAANGYDHSASSTATDEQHGQGAAQSIAQDMNRHAAIVLRGPQALDGAATAAGPSSSAATAAEPDESSPPDASVWRERGGSGLDDLRRPAADTAEELHISNPRRYFERAPQAGGASEPKQASRADGGDPQGFSAAVHAKLDPAAAEQVLLDLQADCRPGLLGTVVTDVTTQSLVPQLQTMLRQTALVCNELLRQFWRCFPLKASAARERQATKLRDFIDNKYKQLDTMQAAAAPEDRPLVTQFLRPLQQALDAAFEAYEAEMRVADRR